MSMDDENTTAGINALIMFKEITQTRTNVEHIQKDFSDHKDDDKEQFIRTNQHITNVETSMTRKIEELKKDMEEKFEKVNNKMDTKFGAMNDKMDSLAKKVMYIMGIAVGVTTVIQLIVKFYPF